MNRGQWVLDGFFVAIMLFAGCNFMCSMYISMGTGKVSEIVMDGIAALICFFDVGLDVTRRRNIKESPENVVQQPKRCHAG